MKALMLAAVMALGATGASALESPKSFQDIKTYTILTEGKIIAEFEGNTVFDKMMVVAYGGDLWRCYVNVLEGADCKVPIDAY